MNVQTLEIKGRRMVQLPERAYLKLLERAGESVSGNTDEQGLPPLPKELPGGGYPALEYAKASLARDIIRTRRRLGLSQAELARRAGIPVETVNRIERAKLNTTVYMVEKIDAVLRAGEKEASKGRKSA
ncbi:MAG: helix-turn-helix transcriptional regulator [Phycisphaerae bacterium]